MTDKELNVARLHALFQRLRKQKNGCYLDNNLKDILAIKDIFLLEECKFLNSINSVCEQEGLELIREIKEQINLRISSFIDE